MHLSKPNYGNQENLLILVARDKIYAGMKIFIFYRIFDIINTEARIILIYIQRKYFSVEIFIRLYKHYM